MIITFYSFKGGVGRSMALANVAEILYRRGLRVLAIDWDLEAPGLDKFFETGTRNRLIRKPGLIDMMVAYKEWARSASQREAEALPAVLDYVQDVYGPNERGGLLKIITSGRRDGARFVQYTRHVRDFDWKDLYDNWEGERYLELVRKQCEAMSDIVLLDSRTGVTEMGNVCIYHLADLVVAFVSASSQSVEGIDRALRSFESTAVQKARRDRPLKAIVVPARVEEKAELTSYNDFKGEFGRLFDRYCPQEWHAETGKTLWSLRIPYYPLYAFEELVAIRQTGSEKEAEPLEEAYNNLVEAIDYTLRLPRRRPPRVLVVEDSPSWQEIIRQILGTIGVDLVDLASTPGEAIARLEKGSYGLITLNLHLKLGMDGPNLLRWMEGHACDVPVIIVSGSLTSVGQFRRWPVVKEILFKGTEQSFADALVDTVRKLLFESRESPLFVSPQP